MSTWGCKHKEVLSLALQTAFQNGYLPFESGIINVLFSDQNNWIRGHNIHANAWFRIKAIKETA